MSLTQSVVQTSNGHRASGRDPGPSSRCSWRDADHSQRLPGLYEATHFHCCFPKRKHDKPFFLLSQPRTRVKYSHRNTHTHTLKCSARELAARSHCLPSLERGASLHGARRRLQIHSRVGSPRSNIGNNYKSLDSIIAQRGEELSPSPRLPATYL